MKEACLAVAGYAFFMGGRCVVLESVVGGGAGVAALPNDAARLPPAAVQKGSHPSPATHAFRFSLDSFAVLFWGGGGS